MKPSVLSTSRTRSRCFEPGIDTFDLLRICALRMRAIMSPIGSLTAIAPSLPARLHKAGNEALGAKFAQRDPAQTMLAIKGARTAGQFATIANSRLGRVARDLGKLQRSSEALLHGQLFVVRNCFQLRAPVCEFLRHPASSVILFYRTLLRHTFTPCGSAYEDKPSLPEREVERGKQRARLVVGSRAGANGNVETPGISDFIEIDLGEYGVLLDAQAVVAPAVEAFRVKPPKVANARQRDIHEPVDEIEHTGLAQGDLAADRLAVAQLVGSD